MRFSNSHLNRKAHLSRSPLANLAFRWPLTYPTPSVFHADQRGMRRFLIRTLWPEFWQATLASMGNHNISNIRDCFWSILHKRDFVRHSKISHLKLFPDPSRHLGEVLEPSPTPWGTPTSARPGSDFKVYFIKDIFLGIVKLVILNFFVTPPDIWVSFWSHPQPHGDFQN